MTSQSLTLPLLPLKSGVVLPGMVFTLALESDEAKAAAEAAGDAGGRILIVPHVDGRYGNVGVVAEVTEQGQLPGGQRAVLVRGDQRAVIGTGVPGTGEALWVEAEAVEEPPAGAEAQELAREYRAVLENILLGRGAGRVAAQLREVTEPGRLADVAGYSPDLSLGQKVEVLETLDVVARLRLVLGWARETLADIALRERIKTDVEEGMEQTQREFLLRRQLEAIRRELGQIGDAGDGDPGDYRTKLEERQLPDHVRSAVVREVDRLERISEQSPENGWIRTWLDTVLELPWGTESEDRLDVDEAARILDEDHDGLEDVKDRIIEHLAVRKLRTERGLRSVDGRGAGAIIALVGPPGVGKTSLGESVARALGRKFVRVALGGVRDEAEIRGHRRTYVGAQPGRLVRAIREAGTMNPVVLLDEVDKLGADYRGDPSSALLEVLDPAQNHTFRDHYLEVELDLSNVLFIATANIVDTVPGPLLDRMEVVRLDGYTEAEKVAIARHHLLGRQLERAALRPDEVQVSDEALQVIVADYTREAGVRSLERELGRLMRKVATKLAAGEQPAPVVVGRDEVRTWLGRPKFFAEPAERTSVPGVVTGLAVTGAGGDVLSVEASVAEGPEGLTLTGQLGDVMKESAEIALSYVRSHAGELGIAPEAFRGRRFHVHVPAGAVPKDGPSAGVTMTTALVSLLRGVPARPTVAMTGEVTLQGRVLPIGGVRQKVLAAHRAGLTEVVLPGRNGQDLEDVPEEVRSRMTFHLADRVADVLAAAIDGHGAGAVDEVHRPPGTIPGSETYDGHDELPAVA
ncbi:MAG TPA: endopeptidase La [Acidimicrobiales bacterium]|nr:endopeptidase La [Acidimicrobiales bacterium]